jgi:inosose dehydratase
VTARFRVAAAPISWGICDVPGWGYQMPFTPVLAEMRGTWHLRERVGACGFLALTTPGCSRRARLGGGRSGGHISEVDTATGIPS